MISLLMIADDFTGALDTGVQFAASGVETRVVVGMDGALSLPAPEVRVLVVDAETRHMAPEAACAVVESLTRQAVDLGVQYIYKKTDSALRGNIGAELTALLRASGEKRPALPAGLPPGGPHHRGRRPPGERRAGGGERVRPGPLRACAPLLCGGAHRRAERRPCPSQPRPGAGDPVPGGEGILVFDGQTPEDLSSTARRLLEDGGLHIMAGCAGFGAVLPALLGLASDSPKEAPQLSERLLVVCGSVNPITVAQLDAAEEAGFARLRLTPRQKLEPGYWNTPEGEADRARIEALLQANPRVLLDSNDAGGNGPTADYAAGLGCGLEEMRVRIASSIGDLVAGLLHSPAVGTLLMTGGDTLLQVMRCAGVRELEPLCELEKGVVLARCTYRGCTRHVITKSGGFGQAALLTDLAARLEAQAEENRNRSER